MKNGCLSFVPGSHKTHPIAKRFVRLEGGGTGFIEIGELADEPDESAFKVEECTAGISVSDFGECLGSLVVIHGNVLHKSEANLSEDSRYIYTFHIIEGNAKYDDQNWYCLFSLL